MKKLSVLVSVIISLCILLTACSDSVSDKLSGKYATEYSEYNGYIPWQIEFKSDGNCLITESEYHMYSCTYAIYDDGKIVIDVPDLMGSWAAEFDGDTLLVWGTGVGVERNKTKMYKVD